MGLIESWSAPYRLFCVLKLVAIRAGYWCSISVAPPSSPALLIVLVLRVMPLDPPPLLFSCASRCCFRRLQRKKIRPPAIARSPMTPPATPPAMAATFDPPSFLPVSTGTLEALGACDGVCMTVRVTMAPPSVTVDTNVSGSCGAGAWLCCEGVVGLVVVYRTGQQVSVRQRCATRKKRRQYKSRRRSGNGSVRGNKSDDRRRSNS
jgi:hypothetical protein